MKIIRIYSFLFAQLFFVHQNYSQDTLTTVSGLKYIVTKKGSGEPAKIGFAADVGYKGFFADGKVFDQSQDREKPFSFVLGSGQVIKGWEEGVALMHVGDQFQLIIPPQLAYGKKGIPGVIPPNATLLFDVELLSVRDANIVAAKIPANTLLDAKQLAASLQAAKQKQGDTITASSGLKYVVGKRGSGEPAQAGKSVEVHYSGFLMNGKMFDSSRDRGEPFEFILGQGLVIKGWDEGIALMRVGDQLRLIIPPQLAYGERGAGGVIPPDATLLFDVELMGVSEPKTSISEILAAIIFEKDIQAAVDEYHHLKKTQPDTYNFKESQLNMLGYQLMQAGKTAEAIEIFKLNVESYPQSANVYDSLGEACLIGGKKELAKINYKKAVELNPKNVNAIEILKTLEKN
ncbi:FKBP-type peptidyl-prolyl cis-trans isomerase [bacterium]|nr:FKBP-type peptidyl-prolyl cis-trans isomerase [bacterium]